MNIDIAAKILGVELPSELRLVKSAYRRMAFILHPDVGGDPAKFRALKEAFDCLMNHPEVFKEGSEVLTETVDGRSLSGLGKGYPLNVNARTCSSCEGVGYNILKDPRWGDCPACHRTGWKHVKCNRCNGTKKATHRGKVVGGCPSCKGTGEFVPHDWAVSQGITPRRGSYYDSLFGQQLWPRNHYCDKCNGIGQTTIKDGNAYAVVCDECKGIGELKLFNPVLPRGLLMAARQ